MTVRMPRWAVVLTVVLVVALIIAVTLSMTALVQQSDADSDGAVDRSASVEAVPNEDYPSPNPTPSIAVESGRYWPALDAAVLECGGTGLSWAMIMQGREDLNTLEPLEVVEVDGTPASVATLLTSSTDALAAHRCLLEMLDAPESILVRMSNTRAIDGTQEATWGAYLVTWTYGSDQGTDAVFSYRDDL